MPRTTECGVRYSGTLPPLPTYLVRRRKVPYGDAVLGIRNDIAAIALGSAFGGAAGNLLDILRRRQIRDFIDLRWWPVFNLADVAITAGVLLTLWMRT